jgi:PAS domain S-box-containing protein
VTTDTRWESEIRVLLVEEDPDFAAIVTTFLERESDRITSETASTTESGLESLAEGGVDCVVSADEFPDGTGIEFLEAVRETHPDLPFILYMGAGSRPVAADAVAAGATDCFRKESGTEQYAVLANRIETLVDGARAQRRQRQQAEALDAAREGIAILDSDGRITYMNRAYAEIHRSDPGSLIGDHWTELYPDNEVEHVRTEVFPAVEEAGHWRGRTTGRRTDGSRYAQDCTMAATDRDTTVCIVRDISGQMESERELNRYRSLFEALEDPMYVLDDEGTFRYVNEAFVETFGYSSEELVGSDVSMIKGEAAVEQGLENLRRILSSDGPDSVYFETTIESKDGRSIPCEDHMGALLHDGSFDGSAGILRDITERKRREEELERRNERLDRFASVVSHDLRNPLNVAAGNVELLREECDSERIEPVDRALTRMDELIADLLQLARVGDQGVSTEVVDLAELARDSWRNVETDGATIRTESDRSLRADPSRLSQLLENLFRNSVEHGGADVTVTVGGLEGGFFVEDDGPGIPEGEREDVFEAGYSTSEDGTGFGLSIVREVVQVHGWTVRVTEGADGGARFEITGVEAVSE